MKTRFKSIMLLRDNKQKVVADGYPYLRIDGIAGCSVEGLDVQMLLDPLEEKFNLPSVTVKFSYCDGFQREVVRQEPIGRPFLKILIYNESERVLIFSGGVVSSKSDGLVRDKASLRIHLPSLDDFIAHIVFRPRHKEGVVEMEVPIERLETNIPFVHQVICARFDRDFIHHLGVMYGSLRDADKRRDRAPEVHHRVHLDGTLPAMEGRPRAQSQAEIDGGTVEGIDHLIQVNAKHLSLIKILCFQHQLFGKVLKNTPILLLVRLCEGRPGHRLESRPMRILSAEVKVVYISFNPERSVNCAKLITWNWSRQLNLIA